MEDQEPEIDYTNIIDTLINTFGEVLSRDVIYTIVESCEGDLEESANAIMNITMDGNTIVSTDSEIDLNQTVDQASLNIKPIECLCQVNEQLLSAKCTCNLPNLSTPNTSNVNQAGPSSRTQTATYALASQNPRALPKRTLASNQNALNIPLTIWPEQIKQILTHHDNGARVLIIMRGVPGSGKTYLARKIIDAALKNSSPRNYFDHILSTDDYFMERGVYIYDKSKISDAHEWNKARAKNVMSQGLSPIIIDNTNIEIWEMEPYVLNGVKNGYIIELLEPHTPWARKVSHLLRRNTHNVPANTIRRMLENFQGGLSGDYLIKTFGYQYPFNMKPPVLRTVPPVLPKPFENKNSTESKILNVGPENEKKQELILSKKNITENSASSEINQAPSRTEEPISAPERRDDPIEEIQKSARLTEIQKCIEEMEKVEKEWENGENWEDSSKTTNQKYDSKEVPISKPPRRSRPSKSTDNEKLLPAPADFQDWTKIYLPSWSDDKRSFHADISIPNVEKKSSSTSVEIGDTDISNSKNPLKIITATPRNINEFHIDVKIKKIPEKWMLDKSTSTNDNLILMHTLRCQNEDQHFEAFRKLFKNIARSDLKDIFDNCCGDVNWAVDIVLDGMANKQLVIEHNDESDTEIESQNVELCKCLSAYNIIPDQRESSSPLIIEHEIIVENTPSPSISNKKVKKESVVSKASLQIKRQIEKNVVISDNHYSQHCLNLRKKRHGELDVNNAKEENQSGQNTEESSQVGACTPDTLDNMVSSPVDPSIASTSKIDSTETSDEESYVGLDDIEKTVNINLGREFLTQLDELFGRTNMKYPENVSTRINMPMSLLNEINALWMESLMYQLEEDEKQSELMVQQDEEFARELAIKEAELTQAGKEPEIPDFKEIMDMDFALSLYQRDVAEWRNNEPNDLAAKLSREKLYNLFPDVSPDILSELLMAHDNNFQLTVEVLLMSMGKADILTEKNGVNKFVMQKEMERQEKLMQEERKTLSEVEWPLLPKWEKVEMSVVQRYRDEADKHLNSRNINYQKAQDYIRRGMTQVATYYSDVAAYHKKKFEQANSLAAASLMQVHAANCSDNATIDLHYLRVGEAKESLDLFLDTHIQKLRESQDKNGIKCHTLFFITGRGLHSNGRPKVKPAVKKRLRERGLNFSERNPGLLTAKVSADDKLSYQIA